MTSQCNSLRWQAHPLPLISSQWLTKPPGPAGMLQLACVPSPPPLLLPRGREDSKHQETLGLFSFQQKHIFCKEKKTCICNTQMHNMYKNVFTTTLTTLPPHSLSSYLWRYDQWWIEVLKTVTWWHVIWWHKLTGRSKELMPELMFAVFKTLEGFENKTW